MCATKKAPSPSWYRVSVNNNGRVSAVHVGQPPSAVRPSEARLSPVGALDNSPPLQWRVNKNRARSSVGTTEITHALSYDQSILLDNRGNTMTSVAAPPIIKLTNYINGQWADSRASEWRDVVNPATGETLAQVR